MQQRSEDHVVLATGSISSAPTVPPSNQPPQQQHASYLPNELLFEILSYYSKGPESQALVARFCRVSRQWYDVAIARLYEAPYISGRAYDLFYATVCPSKNLHIKRSDLAGLVKVLDLSHLVHQGSKAQTARLLSRTQSSLLTFIAPQASFAINCWASLSKCHNLRALDLSLVSESISYQSLSQTLRQLPALTDLYLPRCSSTYDSGYTMGIGSSMRWPLQLRHLTLSGSVHGKFMWDMIIQPESFPRTICSLSLSHCPKVTAEEIQNLLTNLSDSLTHVELVALPNVSQGRMNGVLQWCPNLKTLTIDTDYIDMDFGDAPERFDSSDWQDGVPLEQLKIVTSSLRDVDLDRAFAAIDLFTLIDDRFVGRLRYVYIAQSTGWTYSDHGAEVEALEMMLHELDRENWEDRRWHYQKFKGLYQDMDYKTWVQTSQGMEMQPHLRLLND